MATSTTLPTADSSPPLRVMRPVKRRLRVRDIWASRRVAWMIGQRDVKVKYKQAALGPLWLLIAPLGMLLAITIAFSGVTNVNTGSTPYILFALVGLVVWNYLQVSVLVGAQSIAGAYTLVRRSAMPRLALVVGSLIGNLPPLAVTLGATLIVAIAVQGLPLQALLLPVFLAWLITMVGSITILISAITVRFRDVLSVMPLIVQAGLFVTPVGYPIDGAPHNIKLLLSLNPASGLIDGFRWCLLGMTPDMTVVGIAIAWTFILAAAGWYVFTRMEVTFADVI
jgi:lipopolysaccharide transport system permease protein